MHVMAGDGDVHVSATGALNVMPGWGTRVNLKVPVWPAGSVPVVLPGVAPRNANGDDTNRSAGLEEAVGSIS